jgi:co-chaperonin GroES (HSP10)
VIDQPRLQNSPKSWPLAKKCNMPSATTIIYKPYAMTEVKLNGEEHYLIEEQDVLGRLKND